MTVQDTYLDSIFETSGALMFEASFDGQLQVVNPAWRSALAHTDDDVTGVCVQDMVHPSHWLRYDRLTERLRSERLVVTDLTLRTKLGEMVPVTGTLTSVASENSVRPNIQGVFHQVDEERRSEKELRRFFDLSMDMFCTASLDGHFRLLNPAWERILGFTREELMARSFMDFIHPDDREATTRELAGLAEGKPTLHFENRYLCRDGSYKTLSWTASPGEKETYAVARDVSELETVEEELRRAKDAAETANQAKSRFLATMSHELRTPLNSVIGFTNVLLKDKEGQLSERSRGYLERVRANGTQLLHLINDVLDLSKIEAGKSDVVIEPVDLDELVREVLSEIAGHTQAQGLTLREALASGTSRLEADRGKLKQVLVNLVGNAVKFTERGTVTVRVRTDGRRPIRIEVLDTGIGIAANRLQSIFEPFEQAEATTTRRFGGTGLGLAISRHLCRAMGFALSATSEVDQGSTFVIDLEPPLASSVDTDPSDATPTAVA